METSNLMRQTAMDYRKRICQAMNYISRNLDCDLSLEEIAAAASLIIYCNLLATPDLELSGFPEGQ